MYQFEPVYYDLTIKYPNKLNKIDNIQKINIVKITNNEIFTNYKKKNLYQCFILIFSCVFFLFVFLNF